MACSSIRIIRDINNAGFYALLVSKLPARRPFVANEISEGPQGQSLGSGRP